MKTLEEWIEEAKDCVECTGDEVCVKCREEAFTYFPTAIKIVEHLLGAVRFYAEDMAWCADEDGGIENCLITDSAGYKVAQEAIAAAEKEIGG